VNLKNARCNNKDILTQFVLCEFRVWGGVWYINFNEVRVYVVTKTPLIEIYVCWHCNYIYIFIYLFLDFRIGG
jgi:hypothetical protein